MEVGRMKLKAMTTDKPFKKYCCRGNQRNGAVAGGGHSVKGRFFIFRYLFRRNDSIFECK